MCFFTFGKDKIQNGRHIYDYIRFSQVQVVVIKAEICCKRLILKRLDKFDQNLNLIPQSHGAP